MQFFCILSRIDAYFHIYKKNEMKVKLLIAFDQGW